MLSTRLEAWLRGHRWTVDAVVAFTLAGIGLVGYLAWAEPRQALYCAALLAPLAWRRTRPAVAAAAVVAAAGLQSLDVAVNATAGIAGDTAVPAVVYATAAYGRPRTRQLTLAAGVAGSFVAGRIWGTSSDVYPTIVFCLLAVTGAWAFGMLRRARLQQLEEMAERARLLEAERDQKALLAVSAERTRIAREMHDIVAHSLAVVVAQADGGRYAVRHDPQAAARSLDVIAAAGRDALGELRRLLAVLRAEDEGASPERVAPQPGLADLEVLADRVRERGLPVLLQLGPVVDDVPPPLALAAYRIVQEGLTNVIKHAGPGAAAHVRVHRDGGALHVEVVDDGRGAAAPPVAGGGHGLVGMAERAALFGGRVEAGPVSGGGFAVRAWMPVAAAVQAQRWTA